MDKKEILNALKLAREFSKKRNFSQNIDLIINLNLDYKANPIDIYTQLPIKRTKKLKICALIDKDLSSQAKGIFDTIVLKEDFEKYKNNKKLLKNLADDHAFFVAQADIMSQIATSFGKVLGPRNKMPNPKAGCVIPQKIANLKPIYDKLQNTIKLSAKVEPIVKCSIGQEDMKDEDLAENALVIYNFLLHSLPKELENLKSVYLKLTMGPSVKVGITREDFESKLKQKLEKSPKKEIPKEVKSEESKKPKKEPKKKEVKKDAIKKE